MSIISAEGSAAFEEMFDSGSVLDLTAPEDRIGGFGDTAILATEYLPPGASGSSSPRSRRFLRNLRRRPDRPHRRRCHPRRRLPADRTSPAASAAPATSAAPPPSSCPPASPTTASDLIQLDGRTYSENRLLALALAFQNATGWHQQHPV